MDEAGTIFASGYYFPSAGRATACIIKLTPQGDVTWAKSFENLSTTGSFGYTLTLTPTGGCVLSGQIGPNNNSLPKQSFLLQTDATGELIWAKVYQMPAITAHLPLADGYLLTGQISRATDFPIYLAKVSPNGIQQWYRDNLLTGFYNLPVYLFTDRNRYTVLGNGSTPVPTPGNGFLWAQFDKTGSTLGRTVSASSKGPTANDRSRFGNVVNWTGTGYLNVENNQAGNGGIKLSLFDYDGALTWSSVVVRGR